MKRITLKEYIEFIGQKNAAVILIVLKPHAKLGDTDIDSQQ